MQPGVNETDEPDEPDEPRLRIVPRAGLRNLVDDVLVSLVDVPAEVAAQIQAALVRAAINESDEGIAIFDLSGHEPVIRFANDRYTAMYGESDDAVAGTPPGAFPSLVGPAERLFVLAEIAKLEHGAVLRLHKIITRSDGTTLPIDTEIQPLRTNHDLVLVRWADASVRLATEAATADARESASLTSERERVARDLHDTVIQQLFATGLALLSTAARSGDPMVTGRLNDAVDEIDGAIRQLRTAIFGSNPSRSTYEQTGARQALLMIADEASRMFANQPTVHIDEHIDDDRWRPAQLDLEAVLRECLTNVARHAGARFVSVTLLCSDDTLELCVNDDGTGVNTGETRCGHGFENLTVRAGQHGGTFRLTPQKPRGTTATWCIPAPAVAK
jgi:signal transduction histidine kinase